MYYIPHNQRGGHLLIIRARAKGERAIRSAESVRCERCALVPRVGTREKINTLRRALMSS